MKAGKKARSKTGIGLKMEGEEAGMGSGKRDKREERSESPRLDCCVQTCTCVGTHPASDMAEISIPTTGNSIRD